MASALSLKIKGIESNFKEFNEWRTISMKRYKEICKLISDKYIENTPRLRKALDDYPRCIVQLTRQMCKCNQDCLSESFRNITFDTTCHNLNLDNLYISQKYLPCNMLGIKVLDGKMYNLEDENVPNTFRYRISDSLFKLCMNNQNSYWDLQCSTYELKNDCGDNKECLKIKLRSTLLGECSNTEFKSQIREIEENVGFPEFGVDFEGLRGIVRIPRSSGEYPLQDTNTQSLMQDTSTELLSFTNLCFFILLVFLLGLIGFKLFKKYFKKNKTDTKV